MSMSIRYMALTRTGEAHRAAVVATARNGETLLLTASGRDAQEARIAVDQKIDAIPAEWWTA